MTKNIKKYLGEVTNDFFNANLELSTLTNKDKIKEVKEKISEELSFILKIGKIFVESMGYVNAKQAKIPVIDLISFPTNPMIRDLTSIIDPTIQQHLKKLTEYTNELLENLKNNKKNEIKVNNQKAEKLVNDYNSIPIDYKEQSIAISYEEILYGKNPDIQRHRVSGSYDSWERYFNTLFYLVREDCYRSLRKSIFTIANTNVSDRLKEKEFREIYFYNDARINNLEYSPKGVFFEIGFNIPKTRVSWSKRMLFGSLLIITDIKFSKILLATIVESPQDYERKNKNKSKKKKLNTYYCKVTLLENSYEEIKSFVDLTDNDEDLTFQIFESKAYFESYQHILRRIKEISVRNLPFKDVFIEYIPNRADPIPGYLTKLSTFNYKKIPFYLFGNSWPKQLVDSFDPSQFKAFRHGITNKVAIIQGPPGTGKTYVGSKITQSLIENTNNPILVVCYTNHALDQFLTHILEYNTSIVRIGGRCKSEKLAEYTLNKIRTKTSDKSLRSTIYQLWKLSEQMAEFTNLFDKNKVVDFKTCKSLNADLTEKIIQDFFYLFECPNDSYQILSKTKMFEQIYKVWCNNLYANKVLSKIGDALMFTKDYYFKFTSLKIWKEIQTNKNEFRWDGKNVHKIQNMQEVVIDDNSNSSQIDEDEGGITDEDDEAENQNRRELDDFEDIDHYMNLIKNEEININQHEPENNDILDPLLNERNLTLNVHQVDEIVYTNKNI